jgi:outer membrane receptor protein involved in Fe transport
MAASTAVHAQLEEVVVTATKRAQSMQTVPVSVEALSSTSLGQLRIKDFSDYVQLLPNVQVSGTGPGQNEIYIRGVATEQSILSISTTQGSAPAVALYQDEQPVSFGGRNLDIYATDLKRIEVLPGPQGTLYGASSQAGTIRLITNKPVLGQFQAGVDMSAKTTRGGKMSNAVQAHLNLPLTDRTAVRIAAYDDHQGGWIDNIQNDPANGGYSPSIAVINRNDISQAPVNPNTPFEAADNSQFVKNDFNDTVYAGARVGFSYVADKWDLLVQHTQQNLSTDGVFAYDPNLDGTSSVNRFEPDWNQDDFGLTTWTVNGRVGRLNLIYTGGFLDRSVNSSIDYTGYTNGGGYQVYYMCYASRGFGGVPAANVPLDGTCYNPAKVYQEDTTSKRITHEFRVTTPEGNRLRGLGGVFLDRQTTHTVSAFQLASTSKSNGMGGIIPNTGAMQTVLGQVGHVTQGANAAGQRFNPLISFVNDFTRRTSQVAAFGQIQFDFTPRVTGSLSARWYDLDFLFQGSTNSSFGCKYPPPGFYPNSTNYMPDGSCDGAAFDNDVTKRLQALGTATPQALDAYFGQAGGAAIQQAIANGTLNVSKLQPDGVLHVSDVIPRASIDWQLSNGLLLFGSYSEGYRPPVSNRNAARAANNPHNLALFANYRVPPYATTDTLDNYEVGFKGDFLNRKLRFNATAYYSKIKNLQTSRFDPSNVAFLVFIENVGDAKVKGVDADWAWAPNADLTLSGALSRIHTEITALNPQLEGISVPVGSSLPYTPKLSANLRLRYGWDVGILGGSRAYVTGSVSYTGDSRSGITGNAYFVEDTAQKVYGRGSGLEIAPEGGDFVGGGGQVYPNGRYVQQAYTLVNLSLGFKKDQWNAELFVDNATDEHAQLHIDTLQFTPKVVTNRPRSIGLRLSYEFQ